MNRKNKQTFSSAVTVPSPTGTKFHYIQNTEFSLSWWCIPAVEPYLLIKDMHHMICSQWCSQSRAFNIKDKLTKQNITTNTW